MQAALRVVHGFADGLVSLRAVRLRGHQRLQRIFQASDSATVDQLAPTAPLHNNSRLVGLLGCTLQLLCCMVPHLSDVEDVGDLSSTSSD